MRDAQLARVHAARLDRHEGLGGEPLVLGERPLSRLLARGVAVEGEDDLAGEDAVVHEQTAQDADVVRAERRAARGDRRLDAGQVRRHDVGVALDDHSLLAPGDLLAREIDAVEHLALLVERGLGRVEVLRALVVVVELARPEADDVAARVADRPDEPATEAVVDAALTAACHEPDLDELVVGEPLAAQVTEQDVPALGGVADAEV